MQWVKGVNTFTSVETGNAFTLVFNSLWTEKVVDNGDGTVTITAASPGRHFVLRTGW